MIEDPDKVIYFGQANFRRGGKKFGIKVKDRARHMYVIGKTGMGKSTMLENMAVQDIQNGSGLCFMDPHGGSAEKLLDYVPEERVKDVIYFAPFDLDYPISFNVLEQVDKDARHLVVAGLMSTFKKIWVDAWSARMEYILANTLLALLEYPSATLLGVNRMYTDKAYRNEVVSHVTDPGVRSFWVEEFAKYTDRFAAEATPAIQNKIGQFTSNPLIRNIIGQPTSSFNFREMIDSQKIVIVNLSKGRLGEGNASLLGSMLITKIYLGAMSRADVSPADLENLPNFFFYVDEFQSFANESFADILSEARKYKLNLIIAHQYIEQMEEEVRDAVFGNVGTTIAFRVGPFDAEVLEKVFAPKFVIEDCVNLGFAEIYLTLMIDGVGSVPFSATTLPPLKSQETSLKYEIIQSSRTLYAEPRDIVEERINIWHDATGGKGSDGAPIGTTKNNTQHGVQRGSAKKNLPSPSRDVKQSATKPAVAVSTPARSAVVNHTAPSKKVATRPYAFASTGGRDGGEHNNKKPQITKEAQEALGGRDLKSLLANALKQSGSSANKPEQKEQARERSSVEKKLVQQKPLQENTETAKRRENEIGSGKVVESGRYANDPDPETGSIYKEERAVKHESQSTKPEAGQKKSAQNVVDSLFEESSDPNEAQQKTQSEKPREKIESKESTPKSKSQNEAKKQENKPNEVIKKETTEETSAPSNSESKSDKSALSNLATLKQGVGVKYMATQTQKETRTQVPGPGEQEVPEDKLRKILAMRQKEE